MSQPISKPAGLEAPNAAGFTLIELMVVVALIAIMLTLAAPSFVRFQRDSELVSTANSFVAAMASARAEAMKRNRDAYVVPQTGADWTSGWKVFVDMDRNQTYDDGVDVLVLSEGRVPTSITTPEATGVSQFFYKDSSYVLYNGSGFPRMKDDTFRAGSLEFSYGTDASMRRRVISSPAGRMWVCKPASPGCDES